MYLLKQRRSLIRLVLKKLIKKILVYFNIAHEKISHIQGIYNYNSRIIITKTLRRFRYTHLKN